MPHLFSPYELKGVMLRNRIAMSPMTMYRSVDGLTRQRYAFFQASRKAGFVGELL